MDRISGTVTGTAEAGEAIGMTDGTEGIRERSLEILRIVRNRPAPGKCDTPDRNSFGRAA